MQRKSRLPVLRSRLGMVFPMLVPHVTGGQMRIQKAKCVRHLDYADSTLALLLDDLIAKRLHPRPMHLWPEMVFCVVAIVKPGPVIEPAVGAHSPRNRLVWITAVMAVVAVQIREAVAKVPKRQKETNVMPVKEAENNKRRNETCQLEHSPKRFARIFALQFFENNLGILAKETHECVFQRMLRFTVMAVFVY
jgi:hypothetical protein